MRRRKYPWKQADILIHRYCGRLTTGQRLAVIAVAFALFMAGCLYMILSSLLGFGEPGGGLKIEHIRPLDIKPDFKDYYDYGHSENQDTVRLVC
jgi:hypothetical protein